MKVLKRILITIVAIVLMRFFWQEASTEGFRDQAEMSGFVTPKEQPL